VKPYILIPVRPFAEGKTRLATVLGPAERTALNRRFFDHVFGVACQAVGPARCIVVSRSAEVRDLAEAAGARAAVETGNDLNAALTQGAGEVPAGEAVLVLSTDLPGLGVDDVAAMMAAGAAADVVIAPDRSGMGTNALFLRRPGLIPFQYGRDSFSGHSSAVVVAEQTLRRVDRSGLAMDIDTPEQLAELDVDVKNMAASSA
jgi:2-phospho-L-lactate guanylyltransferase